MDQGGLCILCERQRWYLSSRNWLSSSLPSNNRPIARRKTAPNQFDQEEDGSQTGIYHPFYGGKTVSESFLARSVLRIGWIERLLATFGCFMKPVSFLFFAGNRTAAGTQESRESINRQAEHMLLDYGSSICSLLIPTFTIPVTQKKSFKIR